MSCHYSDISAENRPSFLPRRPITWKSCSARARKKLEGFYACGYLYAKSADLFLERLASYPSPDRQHIWNKQRETKTADMFDEYSGAPSHWFGSYVGKNFRFVEKWFFQYMSELFLISRR